MNFTPWKQIEVTGPAFYSILSSTGIVSISDYLAKNNQTIL